MPSVLVIYNPIAGRGRVQKHWPEVEQALLEEGIEFDSVATQAPLEAMKLAEEAPQQYSSVIAVGGDGTVHEVVNGLIRASKEGETVPLGVVPLGNGDDFAKMIPPEAPVGEKPLNWRTAVKKFAPGETKLFDVGRMTGDHLRPELGNGSHYFANGMDVGFGANTVQNFATMPKLFTGLTAYLIAILRTMINYPILHLRIQVDDQPPFEKATAMTAITNGRCFGNGFWVCPEALADDGLFDIMVADDVNRVAILRLIPKIMKGKHINEPVITMYRGSRLEIESKEPIVVEADGEVPYIETHHLTIELIPKVLRMMV